MAGEEGLPIIDGTHPVLTPEESYLLGIERLKEAAAIIGGTVVEDATSDKAPESGIRPHEGIPPLGTN